MSLLCSLTYVHIFSVQVSMSQSLFSVFAYIYLLIYLFTIVSRWILSIFLRDIIFQILLFIYFFKFLFVSFILTRNSLEWHAAINGNRTVRIEFITVKIVTFSDGVASIDWFYKANIRFETKYPSLWIHLFKQFFITYRTNIIHGKYLYRNWTKYRVRLHICYFIFSYLTNVFRKRPNPSMFSPWKYSRTDPVVLSWLYKQFRKRKTELKLFLLWLNINIAIHCGSRIG